MIGMRAMVRLANAIGIRKNVNLPRIIRPGPCLLPARTKLGGLSTMDMKFGSSPGACLDRRELLDICLHAGHLKAWRLQGSPEKRLIGAFLCTWRKKELEIFMAGVDTASC